MLYAITAVAASAFVGWVLWAAWAQATPQVTSQLVGFTVSDEHATDATVRVALDDGVQARCLLRALAEDHTPVGELSFEPVPGTNRVTIRTERRATSVEKVGCTTPDQARPR